MKIIQEMTLASENVHISLIVHVYICNMINSLIELCWSPSGQEVIHVVTEGSHYGARYILEICIMLLFCEYMMILNNLY